MAPSPSSHLKYIFKQVARAFSLPVFQVEERLGQSPNVQELDAFIEADGPSQLLICRHPDTIPATADSEWDGEGLVVTEGDSCRLEGKGVLLMKVNEGTEIDPANVEREVLVSVVLGSPVKSLLATIEHLYLPLLSTPSAGFKTKLPEESGAELFSAMHKFVYMLSDSASGMEGGVELARPSIKSSDIELKTPAFARAALNSEIVRTRRKCVGCTGDGGVRWWSPKRQLLLPSECDSERSSGVAGVAGGGR
jgi:hypothetical protein